MPEITFRLVANFQYKENYGAHDWDGTGECPQCWKYKGGDSLVLMDGVALGDRDSRMISVAEEVLAEEIAKKLWKTNYSEQYFLGYEWVPSGQPTEDEIMEAYFDYGVDLNDESDEEHDDIIAEHNEAYEKWEDIYIDLAAQYGVEGW